MKILFACQFFNYCSGSAMYVHNIAKELKDRGHDVTILSEVGGDITNSAMKHGIRVIDFSQAFEIQDETFDVMHLNQQSPSEMALEMFPNTPAVFTIHSELSSVETPYHHPMIRQYVGVRASIMEKYKDLNPIEIPIPIDRSRFNTEAAAKIAEVKEKAEQKKKIVLYVGTIDFLREQMVKDLAQRAIDEDFDLWCVGRNFLPYSQPSHVQMANETFFVEKYYDMADEIAGILKGTTYLESSACGKPYRWYEVDERGRIKSFEKLEPMPEEEILKYDLKLITSQFENVYENIRGTEIPTLKIDPPTILKVSSHFPRMDIYSQCKKQFGISWDRGIVITIGETAHTKSGNLSPDMIVHESTHVHQQINYKGGPDAWWKKYFRDKEFRLDQELEAYKAQAEYFRKNSPNVKKKFEYIWNSMATCYGGMVTYEEAMELIPL